MGNDAHILYFLTLMDEIAKQQSLEEPYRKNDFEA